MVSLLEFSEQINKLNCAFRAQAKNAQAKEQEATLISSWYDAWRASYPNTTPEDLNKIVNKAIVDFDRPPTFKQLKELNRSTSTTPVFQRACKSCDGLGTLTAEKEGLTYSFRCWSCENWKGRADTYPLWSALCLESGYKLKTYPTWDGEKVIKDPIKTIPDEPGTKMTKGYKESLRKESLRQEERREIELPF